MSALCLLSVAFISCHYLHILIEEDCSTYLRVYFLSLFVCKNVFLGNNISRFRISAPVPSFTRPNAFFKHKAHTDGFPVEYFLSGTSGAPLHAFATFQMAQSNGAVVSTTFPSHIVAPVMARRYVLQSQWTVNILCNHICLGLIEKGDGGGRLTRISDESIYASKFHMKYVIRGG